MGVRSQEDRYLNVLIRAQNRLELLEPCSWQDHLNNKVRSLPHLVVLGDLGEVHRSAKEGQRFRQDVRSDVGWNRRLIISQLHQVC